MRKLKSYCLDANRSGVKCLVIICLVMALWAASGIVATAQQPTEDAKRSSAKADSGTGSPVSRGDERYRIGPGDVLEVRFYKWQQLTRDAVRVDRRGMIRLPLLEAEVKAACRTEGELAAEISTRYLKFLKNPQVEVFLKEFNSQPVAVIGAVNQPGRFQLQRRVRLLELLAFAGGPSQRAGRSIQIVNAEPAPVCETTEPDSGKTAETGLTSYNLSRTLKGDDDANPYVRPGDTVSVLEAEQAFVVGNVFRPLAIPLREPVTVTRAIAMAGGTMPDTKSDRVRIIRQPPGSMTNTEILIDLKEIDKRRADDLALQAGDIVDVPASGGKRLLRSLIGTIVPTATQLPLEIIR